MELLEVAETAAQKGGTIVRRYFETAVNREVKDDKSFVTVADREAEEAIIAEIKSSFPDHSIFGEESGEDAKDSPYQWVIDPLDGTNNFVNGIPIFCVSIAVLEHGVPVVGVVYHPVGDALYAAEKGKGATWRGTQTHVSDGTPDTAIITFGPSRQKEDHELLDRLFLKSDGFFRSKRYLGCTALELAFVARGGTEGFFCLGLKPYDYAAGVLLIQEAGGKVTDLDGHDGWTMEQNHFIASNGRVHEAMVQLAKAAR
jgi:myo-inositol-1(or 4)-monophosphatase